MSANDFYHQAIEAKLQTIEDGILSDREASTIVMEIAQKLSHQFDKDQGKVASDIDAAFKYKYGEEPSDWADTVRERAMDM